MKLSHKHLNHILSKELLIFDFDGTIVDTSSIHSRAYNKALSSYGFKIDYEELMGYSTKDGLKKIFNQNKQNLSQAMLEELTASKQNHAKNLFNKHIKIITGFDECFPYFHSKKLCIASSASMNSILTGLKLISLKGEFDLILSNESVENAKPSPEIFLKALKFFGVSSEDALIFEDSQAGFAAAKCANIDYIDINECRWPDITKAFNKNL